MQIFCGVTTMILSLVFITCYLLGIRQVSTPWLHASCCCR
jgi:hypothetical protein